MLDAFHESGTLRGKGDRAKKAERDKRGDGGMETKVDIDRNQRAKGRGREEERESRGVSVCKRQFSSK